MKMIKMALLGGAALAVTAGVARADDLTDLKAQIESLNARVAQMEAAPAVPAGYNLLTIGDGTAYAVPGMSRQEQASFAGPVTVMSVLPTADAPAAASIEWSGYVRAILGYRDVESTATRRDDEDADIYARGRLNMTARTDTAVGEIGVRLRLEGNGQGVSDLFVDMPVAWGWWAMTPELTLGGGYQGSLASIGFGYDGACTCHFIDNADVYAAPGDTTQMRLTYASGPMSFAIALEDASTGGIAGSGLGAAGELAYSGDTFSAEIAGNYRATDNNGAGTADTYNIGVGLGFNMDPVALSMAAGLGQLDTGNEFWYVNAHAGMNLSDEIRMELAAGYKDYENNTTVLGVMGGLYYVPVDQLTIGLEAEWVNTDPAGPGDDTDMYVGFVTVYAF